MLFMVIEWFCNRAPKPIYRRLRDEGRQMPDGLKYIDSWITPTLDRCCSNPARQTVSQSERYDRLLETNRSFRQVRMRKECGPITDPQLRQSCFDSFAQYEPAAANATSSRRVASSKSVQHTTPNVGSSTAPRHHQSRSGQ
jgi:hypothetical protein